jgi:hypothetical protein
MERSDSRDREIPDFAALNPAYEANQLRLFSLAMWYNRREQR